MEKKRLVLYGEKTVLLKTRRVPESKKDELEKMIDDFLLKCVNPGYVKSDVYLSDESGVFPFKKDKEENHWKVKKEEKPPKKIEPQVVVEENKKRTPYLVVDSIPFSSEIFINFGKGKAIRKDGDDYYTKETKDGKLLLLKHDSKEDAILYTEINFH